MFPDTISFEALPMLTGLSGGAFITSAVSFMNVSQATMSNKIIGMVIFTMGWIQIIASFDKNETRDDKYKNQLILSSIVVWLSAITLRMMMDNGVSQGPMMMFGMLFMSSWLVIGYSVGQKSRQVHIKSETDADTEIDTETETETDSEIHEEEEVVAVEELSQMKLPSITYMSRRNVVLSIAGLSAPVIVFAAMMIVNGFERPRHIPSGIGLPLFLTAWVILAMTNSISV